MLTLKKNGLYDLKLHEVKKKFDEKAEKMPIPIIMTRNKRIDFDIWKENYQDKISNIINSISEIFLDSSSFSFRNIDCDIIYAFDNDKFAEKFTYLLWETSSSACKLDNFDYLTSHDY